jgi:hypothetical protein
MLAELGLSPTAADLDKQLQRKIDAAKGLIGASRSIDFEAPATEWSTAIRRGEPRPPPLVERLITASAAEALRPDSDPVRARDLQLAAHAAERLGPLAAQEEMASADAARSAIIELPKLLAALQREHRLNRRPADTPAQEAVQLRKAGATARAALTDYANQSDAALAAEKQFDIEPEDLALQANVETSRRSYAPSVALDQRLTQRVRAQAFDEDASLQDLQLAMDSIKAIDQVLARQEELRRRDISTPAQARQFAQEQSALAAEIARIETADRHIIQSASAPGSPDSRQLGVVSMQNAREQLDRIPQQLTAALSAIHLHRQAAQLASQAAIDQAAASPQSRPATTRAVQQAQAALKQAADRLASFTAALSPQSADRLAAQLRLFDPETHDAVDLITRQLRPGLAAFIQAMRADDAGAAERAALPVLESAARIQELLTDSELKLIDRDALTAARWLAQAAAQALAADPPDTARARSCQDSAALALDRAWHDAARDAALTPDSAGRAPRSLAESLPTVRQWAPLRQRQPAVTPPAAPEGPPPAYLESLRLYFEGMYRKN